MEFKYVRKINYYETDRMGIVHHSNYIRFLEESRCRWLEEMGLPMEKMENLGYTIPVLEVYCKYKYHVTIGDEIVIIPKIEEYNGVRMRIRYEVIDKNTNKEILEAWTSHCFTNRDLKPVNLKKSNEEIYKVFEENYKN